MAITADIVIIGAGIMGLSIARELKRRQPNQKIIVLEKETTLGIHASGRNSGVLHTGIYYAENSLKAKVCAEGAREIAAYCDEQQLPIKRVGKVILPIHEDNTGLDLLFHRAKANGAKVELIDTQQLCEVEPEAYSITGKSLYLPKVAVIDPVPILFRLANSLRDQGVELLFNREAKTFNSKIGSVHTIKEAISFGHLFNTAGLYADKVARAFGIGREYTILPFKGLYYRLNETSGLEVNGHIYPVPDLRVPFLGVHFTKKINGEVYVGPTAIPAFGRENYQGLEGLDLTDTASIILQVFQQYRANRQGFRKLVHEEGRRFLKKYFVDAAKVLIPKLKPQDLSKSKKVGIRAQLMNIKTNELVMDFLIQKGEKSTHILNAVSPAFTSAFSFSRFILDHYYEYNQSKRCIGNSSVINN
ncbi:MAG: L-2-hydroxyglutarate oxidase [Waddliaceae bacterium]